MIFLFEHDDCYGLGVIESGNTSDTHGLVFIPSL